MARRLIITAGWLAAAVLAVLVGLVAISVIGDGLVSSLARPLNESQVARELAAEPTSAPPPPVTASPSPSPSAAASSFKTPGGTVVARCGLIISMSPAQGYNVHEQHGAEGEFRGVSDNHDRVKVKINCPAGTPDIEIRTEKR